MSNEQVKLTPELIERAQKRLDYILREGCVHPAVSSKIDTDQKPDWYDEERFKRAQETATNCGLPLGNSILIGLLLIEQLPFNLVPLLATGQSKNVSKLFNRYLNTILHLNTWYREDPFDSKSKAYKSLKMVKNMHQNSTRQMNKKDSKLSVYEFVRNMLKETGKTDDDINRIDIEKIVKNKNRIWVSQADMASILWGFIGPFLLETSACGIHNCTKETYIEVCYVWRVLNYKMGVDDEFNLLSELDFDLIYTMCKLMFEQEFLPYLENAYTPVGIRMSQGTSLALEQIVSYCRWRSFVGYWYKVLNINAYKLNRANLDSDKYEFLIKPLKTQLTDNDKELLIKNGYNVKYIVQNPELPFEEIKLESFSDRIYQYVYQFFINVVFRFQTIRSFLGRGTDDRMTVVEQNKMNIMNQLKENYDDHMKYPACPFTGVIKNDYIEYADLK